MPASAIVAGAGGVISMGTSIVGAISSGKRAKKIEKQIEDYQRQQLTNPFERLQVSTAGADLQREDIGRSVATGIDKLAMGGSRALIGGLPNMLEQQVAQEQKISADLDQQYNQNQQLKAQGDGMVQQMQERREEGDLAGLGNALNTARQEKSNYMNQLASSAMATGIGLSGAIGKDQALKSMMPSGAQVGLRDGIVDNVAKIGSGIAGSNLSEYELMLLQMDAINKSKSFGGSKYTPKNYLP